MTIVDQEIVEALNRALLKNNHVIRTLFEEFGYGYRPQPDDQVALFNGNITEAHAMEIANGFLEQSVRNLALLERLRRGNIKQTILATVEEIVELPV